MVELNFHMMLIFFTGEKEVSIVIKGTTYLIISDRQTSNDTSILDSSIISHKLLKSVFLERWKKHIQEGISRSCHEIFIGKEGHSKTGVNRSYQCRNFLHIL